MGWLTYLSDPKKDQGKNDYVPGYPLDSAQFSILPYKGCKGIPDLPACDFSFRSLLRSGLC